MARLHVVFILLLWAVPVALAEERILSFHSEIIVEKNGDLLVTEIIKVRVEGVQIERGIYRDLPTRRRGKADPRRFEILSVKRNGSDELFFKVSTPDWIRIKIGHRDRMLRSGSDQTYEIVYRTGRQLYFEEGRDMLYWNVNGTEWNFVADKVSAAVTLPDGIEGTKIWGYTGTRGKQEENYIAALTGSGATIETTQRLRKKENLTFALEWPPGLLDAQAYEDADADADYDANLWVDYPLIIVAVVLHVLTIIYFLIVWGLVGRDPKKGPVIPLYRPPSGLSAAALRYIDAMGHYDDLCFTAGVLGLGAKGAVRIEKEGKCYTVRNTSDKQESSIAQQRLSNDENKLKDALLGHENSVELESSNYNVISRARKEHQEALAAQAKGPLFRLNSWWFIPGFVLSLFAIFFGPTSKLGFLMLLLLFAVVMPILPNLASHRARWIAVYTVVGAFAGVDAVLLLLDISRNGPWLDSLDALERIYPRLCILSVLVAIGLNHGFLYLLMARTRLGRKVADGIEGFRRYLSVAEEERLRLYPPSITPEKTLGLFEEFLPYAVALGCEKQWSEQFAKILRTAGTTEHVSYYSGAAGWSSGEMGGISGVVGDISGGFSSSLASSAGAPSSGGGGGGGGSGGGGGGGGGGGW